MSDKICTYCRLIKPADTFRTCHITDICIDCYEKHIVINLTSYEPNEIQLNDKLIKPEIGLLFHSLTSRIITK